MTYWRGYGPGRRPSAAGPNLFLVPSHPDLAAAEVELAGVVGREVILRDKLRAKMRRSSIFFLVDCPPSLGVLTLNALGSGGGDFHHLAALHAWLCTG